MYFSPIHFFLCQIAPNFKTAKLVHYKSLKESMLKMDSYHKQNIHHKKVLNSCGTSKVFLDYTNYPHFFSPKVGLQSTSYE